MVAVNDDFGVPISALTIDPHSCVGRTNSNTAQIAQNFAHPFQHARAIVTPLVLIIVADKIGDAGPVSLFDRSQKVFGVTVDLPLRLPKPDEKQTDEESEAETAAKSLTEPTGHACDVSGSRIKSKTMSESMSKLGTLDRLLFLLLGMKRAD